MNVECFYTVRSFIWVNFFLWNLILFSDYLFFRFNRGLMICFSLSKTMDIGLKALIFKLQWWKKGKRQRIHLLKSLNKNFSNERFDREQSLLLWFKNVIFRNWLSLNITFFFKFSAVRIWKRWDILEAHFFYYDRWTDPKGVSSVYLFRYSGPKHFVHLFSVK